MPVFRIDKVSTKGKVNNGFYIITTDSAELWVDKAQEVK